MKLNIFQKVFLITPVVFIVLFATMLFYADRLEKAEDKKELQEKAQINPNYKQEEDIINSQIKPMVKSEDSYQIEYLSQ